MITFEVVGHLKVKGSFTAGVNSGLLVSTASQFCRLHKQCNYF